MKELPKNISETAYMGTKEAANRWNVSQQTVSRWCREKKIPGAEQDAVGSPWRISEKVAKPIKA